MSAHGFRRSRARRPLLAAVPTRSQATSAAALLLALVALLLAVRQLPRSLRDAHARVTADAGLSSLQRELAPARFWGMNERLLLRAQQVIPANAIYTVAAGRRQSAHGVPLFYGYWLLPRRHTRDLHATQWIVLWGKSRSALGVPTELVARAGGGEILRVRR
jgi:hypothetical protein